MDGRRCDHLLNDSCVDELALFRRKSTCAVPTLRPANQASLISIKLLPVRNVISTCSPVWQDLPHLCRTLPFAGSGWLFGFSVLAICFDNCISNLAHRVLTHRASFPASAPPFPFITRSSLLDLPMLTALAV